MKKIFYCLLVLLFTSSISFAQDEIDESLDEAAAAPAQSSSNEIWGKNTSKINDNASASKWTPRPPSKVNAPIDGGLLVLLGAGVLYGRKRMSKKVK